MMDYLGFINNSKEAALKISTWEIFGINGLHSQIFVLCVNNFHSKLQYDITRYNCACIPMVAIKPMQWPITK